MITFSKIGKKGNLGNQLFQIASTIGLATKNNRKFSFLLWKYQDYFKNKLPVLSLDLIDFENLQEQEYQYHHWNLLDKNYDFSGWLQTEKYFDKELTKHYFEFSDSLKEKISKLYDKAFEKPTILISIRRGDFVNHPDYFQLPINYYLNSLHHFFPDWESYNLIVLGDDMNYCKFHFSFFENAFFGDELNEVEQLCLGSLCEHFIISNSTFSWWSAWLGEKSDSKIIRPLKNFDGPKALELNDKDYYPERWIKYSHLDQKIHLTDLVFSINSVKNKDEIRNYLSHYFEVEFVSKANGFQNKKYSYVINKDYFMPPVLVYYSWLKIRKSNLSLLINNIFEVFEVSKTLNFNEFKSQNDFGFFSKIFSISGDNKRSKNGKQDVYLKKITSFDSPESFGENKLVIDCTAGRFLSFGGYNFSLRRLLKRKENQIKRSIKKILNIKK